MILSGILGGIAGWHGWEREWREAMVWGGAFLVVAVLGVIQLILVNSHSLVDEGRCARCGYDLRASGDRCSECGAVTPKVSQHHFRRWLHLAMKLDDPGKCDVKADQ